MSSEVRFDISPCPPAAVMRLERELGVSDVFAQVLVRRGLSDPAEALRFLDAAVEHDPSEIAGMAEAVALLLDHVQAGAPITVHGDYDVDGVCATAVLVRALRALDARVDWYIPARADGYGLSTATVARLARRGTRLLITVDCGITAVEEVAAARAAGIDVIVTDHHAPRADGALPDARVVHPAVGGYPCPDLCGTAVAYKLAQATHRSAGTDPQLVERDLDLVALATVADVVPLLGENRRLVRAGLRALAASDKPGVRALLAAAGIDPGAIDTRAVGFRLAPRINAAGRMQRADVGLELLLVDDDARARELAGELERANLERRHVETRILFEAEAQIADQQQRRAYVVAGAGWHVGVVGIVAARLAERYHRPALAIALEEDRARGSGRSIAGFDLLGALRAGGSRLGRFGGHAAAVGFELSPADLTAFTEDFVSEVERRMSAEELVPVERVDAIACGDELSLTLAEELARLEPTGHRNRAPSLLLPAARLLDQQLIGEGRHVRFTLEAGGARSSAVAFGTGGRLAFDAAGRVEASVTLERNVWRGAVEPRLHLRRVRACAPDVITIVGEQGGYLERVLAELAAELPPAGTGEQGIADPLTPSQERGAGRTRTVIDRRGRGIAGSLRGLLAGGDRVLVICACTTRRIRHLEALLGGFDLCSYHALERDPGVAASYEHLFLLDPPALAIHERLARAGRAEQVVQLNWGMDELRFSQQIHELEYGLRAPLAAFYRVLRDTGRAQGGTLEAVLRDEPGGGRTATLAGRMLRVLTELGLVEIHGEAPAVTVSPPAVRTSLERSAAFKAYEQRYVEGARFLRRSTAEAA